MSFTFCNETKSQNKHNDLHYIFQGHQSPRLTPSTEPGTTPQPHAQWQWHPPICSREHRLPSEGQCKPGIGHWCLWNKQTKKPISYTHRSSRTVWTVLVLCQEHSTFHHQQSPLEFFFFNEKLTIQFQSQHYYINNSEITRIKKAITVVADIKKSLQKFPFSLQNNLWNYFGRRTFMASPCEGTYP